MTKPKVQSKIENFTSPGFRKAFMEGENDAVNKGGNVAPTRFLTVLVSLHINLPVVAVTLCRRLVTDRGSVPKNEFHKDFLQRGRRKLLLAYE